MSEYRGIIQQTKTDAIWYYWKFAKVMDWGSKEKMEERYPEAAIYDNRGNKIERTVYPQLRAVK
jgi:hypothetical protein